MNIKKQLGLRLKQLRLENNLTQEALAEKANISPKSLSQIELGNNFISEETLEALCKVLNIKPNYLFNFEEQQESEDIIGEINKRLTKNKKLTNTIYKIIKALDK